MGGARAFGAAFGMVAGAAAVTAIVYELEHGDLLKTVEDLLNPMRPNRPRDAFRPPPGGGARVIHGTPKRVIAPPDITPRAARAARPFIPGLGPIILHAHMNVDGKEVAKSTLRHAHDANANRRGG
jgi:hypothetical protein